MPITGATQAVTAAAPSVTITGTFATPYQISVEPDWNTTCIYSGKTTSQFTVTFGTPAPAGGGNVDWIVLSPAGVGGGAGTVTLANYRTELRRLLHDPNDVYWSVADKDSAINLGLQRRDLDSGQNRTLVNYTLVAGTDTYTLTTIGNTSVFDVVGIALTYGSQRVILNHLSYTDLTARYRAWTSYRGTPECWARYGPASIVFGPVPAIAYAVVLDCSQFSSPLVNPTDTDPLPYPYTVPVPFYAAYICKVNERMYDEADQFLTGYIRELGVATNARAGMVPSVYGGAGWPSAFGGAGWR